MRPKYHLFIPQLLQQLTNWYQDFRFDANAPNLCQLLRSHFVIRSNNTKSSHSIYTAFFDIGENQELPVAFYRQQLHLDKTHPYIACADPVYFEVSMNDVTLTKTITDLSEGEAQELIAALNSHFKEDGLQFKYGSNQHWYIVSEQAENLRSYDLDVVFQQNIVDKLAVSDQRNWRVIQNEIQMILHGSDINQHREISGLKPINSLWIWGAGQELSPRLDLARVVSSENASSEIKGKMFAKVEACDWQVLPEKGEEILRSSNSVQSDHLIILDHLFESAIENNLEEYQSILSLLDDNFIAPLLHAWLAGKIEIEINSCNGQIVLPKRVPSWQFWVKPPKLHQIH